MTRKEKEAQEQATLAWQHTVDCAIAQTNPAELDAEQKSVLISFIQQHMDGAEDAEKVYLSRVAAVAADNSSRKPVGSVTQSFEKKRNFIAVLEAFFMVVFFAWNTGTAALMFMLLCIAFLVNMNCIKEMQNVAANAGAMWKTILGVQLDSAEKKNKLADTLNMMEACFLEFFHTRKTRKAIAVWEDSQKAARRDRATNFVVAGAGVLAVIYAVDIIVEVFQFIGGTF